MNILDTRVKPGRGRLETKLLTNRADCTTVTQLCAGDGSRVGLLFCASPDTGVISSNLLIGPRVGALVVPVRALCMGILHCALTLEKDGDIVFEPLFGVGSPGFVLVSVYGVIWHPEGQ